MKQLSGLDATFLHLETAEMPMHVGALNIYELPAKPPAKPAAKPPARSAKTSPSGGAR